jgi:peptidoglycan-N-acetylglucosamine deacetylase
MEMIRLYKKLLSIFVLLLISALCFFTISCSKLPYRKTLPEIQNDLLAESPGEQNIEVSPTPDVSEQEPVQEQILRNEFLDSILIEFKETVERQASEYPEYFYLHSPSSKKQIALTFDDGPDGKYTPEILDVLKEYNVKATFFLLGQNMEHNPEMTKRIVDEGHAVGNHSYSHPDFRYLDVEDAHQKQVLKTQQVFEDILGFRPAFFRPPYGAVTDEQIRVLGEESMIIIDWSIETFDWSDTQNSPEKILNRIKQYHHGGAVVVMHSAGGDRSNTITVLPQIIEFLQNEGYELVTIEEMFDNKNTD